MNLETRIKALEDKLLINNYLEPLIIDIEGKPTPEQLEAQAKANFEGRMVIAIRTI